MTQQLRIIIFCFFILLFQHSSAQTACLNSVEKILNEWQKDMVFKHASLGFKAVNLSKSTVIAEFNAEKSLTPASVMKTITIGMGFLAKDVAYPFKTLLQYTGTITQDSILHGDVIIYGNGDPTLGSLRFKEQSSEKIFSAWEKALHDTGIKSIEGGIVADASYFTGEPYPDGWTWGDIGNYYGAGIYGLNFMDNEYTVFFKPGKKAGDSTVIVRIEPEIPDIQFINHVTTASANTGDQTTIYGSIGSNEYYIRGTIPLQTSEFSIRGAMPDPAKVLAYNFHNYLISKEFEISENPYCGSRRKEKLTTFYVHSPLSYEQIADFTMKHSVNIYAEAILLSIKSQNGTRFRDNARFIENYLNTEKISTFGFHMVDGSGLSRSNYLSPEFLCDFLKMMYASVSFKNFYETFPVAGVSGTLSGMCKGTCAQNNLRTKSGSMNAVRAYSGYVNNSDGDIVCFALIINNFDCKQSELTKKIEKLFIALAESK